jgi:hypothetical protein
MGLCHKEILTYYKEGVRLTKSEKNELDRVRQTNRDRVASGLEADKKPAAVGNMEQGSYTMDTGVQHPDKDYDIDDGIIFAEKDLKDENGQALDTKAAKERVCKAAQHGGFNKAPRVLKNCVRVYYEKGYHVDIPVYRQMSSAIKGTYTEIAGDTWRESDPSSVTTWFDTTVVSKSPDSNDDYQMRRMVCLVKKWARSRTSWELPSGIVLSVLVNEKYSGQAGSDDTVLHQLLKSILVRLDFSLVVYHPVLTGETISKEQEMKDMRDKLRDAVEALKVLDDSQSTKKARMKAWNSVFNTDFFDRFLDESDKALNVSIPFTSATPTAAVNKEGGGRFGGGRSG